MKPNTATIGRMLMATINRKLIDSVAARVYIAELPILDMTTRVVRAKDTSRSTNLYPLKFVFQKDKKDVLSGMFLRNSFDIAKRPETLEEKLAGSMFIAIDAQEFDVVIVDKTAHEIVVNNLSDEDLIKIELIYCAR